MQLKKQEANDWTCSVVSTPFCFHKTPQYTKNFGELSGISITNPADFLALDIGSSSRSLELLEHAETLEHADQNNEQCEIAGLECNVYSWLRKSRHQSEIVKIENSLILQIKLRKLIISSQNFKLMVLPIDLFIS